MQLVTYRTGRCLQFISNSVLGLVDIYNILPSYVVEADTVKTFQKRLQELLRLAVNNGAPSWQMFFSPRNAIYNNALRDYFRWKGGVGSQSMDANTSSFFYETYI